MWFKIKKISWSTSENPNMALCGDNDRITKLLLKLFMMLVQSLIVIVQFAKRWVVVSSSSLQKEHSFVFVLSKVKSFLLVMEKATGIGFKNNFQKNTIEYTLVKEECANLPLK